MGKVKAKTSYAFLLHMTSHERQGPTSKNTLSRKLSFRMEGKIKCFPDKVKLREFIITKSLLYEMLKGFI